MHSSLFLDTDILTCHVYSLSFQISKWFQSRQRNKNMHSVHRLVEYICSSNIYNCNFFYLYHFPTQLCYLLSCPFHHPSFLHDSVCERRSMLPHLCQKTTATLLLWAILFPYIPIWRIAYDNDFKTGQLALLSVLAYVDVCYSFWPQYQTRLLSFLAVKAPANESTETLPLHWSERRCICRHPDVLRLWKWRLWVKAWTFALPLTVQSTDSQDSFQEPSDSWTFVKSQRKLEKHLLYNQLHYVLWTNLDDTSIGVAIYIFVFICIIFLIYVFIFHQEPWNRY